MSLVYRGTPERRSDVLASLRIDEAAFTDHAAIVALLAGAALPVPGPEDAPVRMLVARDAGAVVGCIGFERGGPAALLRSLAISPDLRRQGLGRALVGELLPQLARNGVTEVALLTTSAADFFARLGFTPIARARLPPSLAHSRELTTDCCASAICMLRTL